MEKPVIKPRFSAVLGNRSFMFLWVGQLLSQLADRLYIYVLIIFAYNLTKTNLGVAVPMLSFGIPSVLFASFAGVFVDRWNKKNTMIISDILRGILILSIIFVAGDSLLLIFIISFLIYTIAQFFAPAETSALSELVEKENLIVANSLFMATWMWSSVMGFGIGAPLVFFFGENITFAIAAGLYFISALSVLMVSFKARGGPSKESIKTVWEDLVAGFVFLSRNVVIKYSLFKMMIITSGLAVISVLAIQFAEKYIGIGAKNFGFLVIFAGVGMMLGMWALGRLSHRFKKSVIVFSGFFISGITLILLASTRNVLLALVYCTILGFGNILINATVQTIMQQNTPKSLRGRIFGIQNMLINFAFTVPVVVFGAVADYWGLDKSIMLLGAIVLFTAFTTVFIPKMRTI